MSLGRQADAEKKAANDRQQEESIYAHYQRVNENNARKQAAIAQAQMEMLTLSAEETEQLYQHFFREIETSIGKMEAAGALHAQAARDFLESVKSTHNSFLQKFQNARVEDNTLLDILDKTSSFLKTPMLNNDKSLNPQFSGHIVQLSDKLDELKSQGNKSIGMGIVNTLVGLVAASTAAVICILSGGIITPFVGIALAVEGGFIGYSGIKAAGLFRQGHKSLQIAKRSNALIDAAEKEAERQRGPSMVAVK